MPTLNPGPINERGEYSPELATVTYRDVVKKGWRRRPERIPVFWRPAVAKALAAHEAWQQQRETELRFGPMPEAMKKARLKRAFERFPGLVTTAGHGQPEH